MSKYILVTGSRTYPDLDLVDKEIWNNYDPNEETFLIYGAARGVDMRAALCAKMLGITTLPFPARWDKYGRAAGPIRNELMANFAKEKAREGHEVFCLAFPLSPREKGSGTWDMIDKVRRIGLPMKEMPKELTNAAH